MSAACPQCAGPIAYVSPHYSETLVGHMSPPGHDHDDNCRIYAVQCANGHSWAASPRRTCPAPGCDWRGREECFCHKGKKIDWPPKT